MHNPLNSLIRLNNSHIRPVAEVLTNAFFDDPLYEWLFPDAMVRARLLPRFFQLRMRLGVRYGEAYSISDRLEGVAVWYPSEAADISPVKVLLAGGLPISILAGKTVRSKLMDLSRFAEAIHHRTTPFPHWYLSPLAVDPMHQEQGVARKLLSAMLCRLDAEGMPCFLETQQELNVAIYEKYGFSVVESGAVPGTGLHHWAMLRQPR